MSLKVMLVCICVCDAVSMGVLCCPLVWGMCMSVNVCLGVSPWCPRGSLSVALASVYSELYFVCGMRGSLWCFAIPAWLGASVLRASLLCPNAAPYPCVFVCDVFVSPSADGCPPLYVMCLSMRVSTTCVSHVWAAYVCLTSASWRGAHVSMLVTCHSAVQDRHSRPCVPHPKGLLVPVRPSLSPPSWQPMLLGSQLP